MAFVQLAGKSESPLGPMSLAPWTGSVKTAFSFLSNFKNGVRYQRRLGGAAVGTAEVHRAKIRVKMRRGWRTGASVARYKRLGQIHVQLNRLFLASRLQAVQLASRLPEALSIAF